MEAYNFSKRWEKITNFFNHKTEKGELTTRNAFQILDLYEYPSKIITVAKETKKLISL